MKSNKLKLILALFFVISLFVLSFSSVLADNVQKRGLETSYPIINGIEITATSTIETYAVYLFSLAMIIGAILTFVILIYGGFRYVTSSGNPVAMGDAKKWIWSAILGLILLLCAWIIIGLINKEILNPKVEELKETFGIYLIDKNGEKIPYSQKVVNSIPDYFEVEKIEFISDKPADPDYADPNKDELISVFIYSEKGLKGDVEEIENPGAGATRDVSNVGSMFLLWQESGIYLYKKTGFGSPPRPKFLDGSQTSFKEDFDNKIKSLKIVDDLSVKSSDHGFYYVVLFEEPDYNRKAKGRCNIVYWDENAENLSTYDVGGISSIAIFKEKELHGEIKFFDMIRQDEDGNKYIEDLTGQSGVEIFPITLTDTELDSWKSIAIDANAIVILCTEENIVFGGYCRLFEQDSEDGDNLKTTSIYNECLPQENGIIDPECEEYLPLSASIAPKQE